MHRTDSDWAHGLFIEQEGIFGWAHVGPLCVGGQLQVNEFWVVWQVAEFWQGFGLQAVPKNKKKSENGPY